MSDYSSLKPLTRSWFVQSKHDLEAAEANAEAGRYDLACFLAHQSAEKAVVRIHLQPRRRAGLGTFPR